MTTGGRPGPETVHPDLTMERLQLVGATLAAARDGAQEGSRKELGDNSWVVGCTAFARSCEALIRLATGNSPWLGIEDPTMKFVFTVGAVPVRFYHGDAGAPSPRHAEAIATEESLLQEVFAFAREADVAVFRLAVETDSRGLTVEVELIQCLHGDNINRWSIWQRPAAGDAGLPEGVELGPPDVGYESDAGRATGTGDGAE